MAKEDFKINGQKVYKPVEIEAKNAPFLSGKCSSVFP